MKWLDWKKQEGNCKHCKMFYIDEVPRNFEDPKLGLQALEFPVICKHCPRTRFYAVRKKINAFITPEEYEKIPKFEIKRRGKKNKW